MDGSGYYVASLDEAGRRVRGGGLFARGNGRWSIDEGGLSFLRALTKRPIVIARARIRSVVLSSSSWWAGKWLPGSRVVEVRWEREDGSVVVSGFVFSGRPAENARLAELLRTGLSAERQQGGEVER